MVKSKCQRELELKTLKKWIIELLDAVEDDLGIDKITLSNDYYWTLEPKSKYSFENEPTNSNLLVGQLFDDLDFLILGANESAPLSRAQLCHVVPLLGYLDYCVNEKIYEERTQAE